VKARVQLSKGDVASAQEWAADSGLSVDDEPAYVREYEQITLARTLLVGSGGRAAGPTTARFLERLLDAARQGQRRGSVIELLVLSAVADWARGERPAAATMLAEALELAEPEGYTRLFLDAGPAAVGLLQSADLHDHAAHLGRRLLAMVKSARPVAPPSQALVDELSGRELDVLRLLRSELSGPEIARELHMSLNTLRTHTKSIYTKLGATNRREAIRLAAEHGL
jgi:LuxR family maltose regulon positive regulatory protein